MSKLLRSLLFSLGWLSVGSAAAIAPVESRTTVRDPEESVRSSKAPLLFEVLRRVEFLQQELQELRGKLEEQAHQLQQLQTAHHAPSPAAKPAPEERASVTLTLPSSELSEEKAYEAAYRLIQSKQYEEAIFAFEDLLQSFPEGKYAPNVYYWLGEVYLLKKVLPKAEAQFLKVYQHYSAHPKAADALLKLGYVACAQEHWPVAVRYLKQVTTQFPNTTSAQLAETRLAKLRRENHA